MMRGAVLAVAFTGVPPDARGGVPRPSMSAPRMAHSSSSADAAAVGWGGSADAGSVPFRYSDKELERKLRFANGLAFLSGVADVATYSTAGCYASMMTGNTINFMSAVAANRLSDGLFFLAMVVNYVAGISGFRLLSLRKGLPAAALAPCILVLFAAVDGLMLSTASRWPLLLLALCFGANRWRPRRPDRHMLPAPAHALPAQPTFAPAAARTALASPDDSHHVHHCPTPFPAHHPAGIITCMVTGHFQKIGDLAANAATGPLSASQRRTALTSASIVLAFTLGVGTGSGLRRAALGPAALGATLRRVPTFTALGAAYAALLTWGDRAPESAPAPMATAGLASGVDPPAVER
eukprot:scaffold6865_cov97-Isochrysis_galbana.AAC.4